MTRLLLLVLAMGCQAHAFGTTNSSTSTSTPGTGGPTASSTDDRASGASESAIITLPDTVGKNQRDAEAALRSAGVTGEIKLYNDPGTVDFAVATVCAQNPGGGQQTRATLHVVLRYCQPEVVKKDEEPDLRGLTVEEATKRARATGFNGPIRVVTTSSGECKHDTVCKTSSYWYKTSSELTLYVSRAAAITMPD